MEHIVKLISAIAWIAGVVIANGVFSTAVAFFFPPWAWYLVVERVLFVNGLL